MSNTTNTTFTVSGNVRMYGNQLCTPASWTDILTFYLSNYVTHVATVQSFPGEYSVDKFLALTAALFMPVTGVGKGLDRLIRCAVRGQTTLEKAARAGALCMVVRDRDWKPVASQALVDTASYHSQHTQQSGQPLPSIAEAMGKSTAGMVKHERRTWSAKLWSFYTFGDTRDLTALMEIPSMRFAYHDKDQLKIRSADVRVYNAQWQREGSIWWEYLGIDVISVSTGRKMHGTVRHPSSIKDGLPAGYKLVFVPHNACVECLEDDITWTSTANKAYASGDDINSSYDLVSAIASVVQLLFGLSTLYNAVGPQVSRFGYPAFGLTVLQYSLISLINLLAAMVTPAYTSVYLVESEVMEEAISRGAVVKGIVGRLMPDHAHTDAFLATKANRILLGRPSSGHGKVLDEAAVKSHDAIDTIQATSSTRSIDDEPDLLGNTAQDMSKRQRIPVYTLSGRDTSGRSRSPADASGDADEDDEDVVYIPSHPRFKRHNEPYSGSPENPGWTTVLICTLIGCLPLIPIGVLTHFKNADSTYGQRVIVMLWFAMNVFYGTIGARTSTISPSLSTTTKPVMKANDGFEKGEVSESIRTTQANAASLSTARWTYTGVMLIVIAPGFAGLVTAGMMFASFGTCSTIS